MMEEKLPKGWKLLSLSEAVEILDYLRVPVSSSERAKRIGDIPYYGATGQTGWIDDHIFDEELVLLGEDGAPFFDKKKNVAYLINGKSWVNNHAHVLRAKPKKTENKYAYYFLNHFDYAGFVGGTTRLKLTQGNLKSIPIPIPPLAEQQRIVAKLDAIFGHLDSLREKLNRIPDLLKNFRQQVLTQAVTGELTKEWREGKGLVQTNLNLKNKFEIEFELFDYQDLPDSWKYTALGNFIECSRGKFSVRPRNDPRYFDGDYPFIQIGDLPKDGGEVSSFSKTLNNLGKEVSKEFLAGTVVIAIVGATIGNTGILTRNMFFPDSLIGINTKNQISNQFVEYFLRAIKLNLRQLSYAGGGQPNIKLNNIQNLAVALPPFNEQQEILKRVDALFELADKIESQYQSLKTKIDQLPQAILAKAFRGELVEREGKEYRVEEGVGLMAAEEKADYETR